MTNLPPTRLETWLNSLSNDQLAALVIGIGVVFGLLVMGVRIVHIVRMERALERASAPSLEDNIARLEAECAITPLPTTRAVHSGRKSPRRSA